MPAERAGYTVTMFLVDISATMANTRDVELPEGPNGEARTVEVTNLEWSLQFVKLKIQEMIFNGRKTDQCGIIIFGAEETDNMVNAKNGGYENVVEYIPIGQPNAGTLAKLSELKPSSAHGDPIDALIVAVETQNVYLASKKTWTRKVVLLTDGENPMEVEDWEATAHKMNQLNVSLTIAGIDFDEEDEEYPFKEQNKSVVKRANEEFFDQFVGALDHGFKGTCALALQETARPDVKQVKSTLMGNVLRLGDPETRAEEAMEILIKTSKCTALTRPKGWKRFGDVGIAGADQGDVKPQTQGSDVSQWSQLKMRTEYFVDADKEGGAKKEEDIEGEEPREDAVEKIAQEELVRGFKFGASYVPSPEGQFPKLSTAKGIDLCGFFQSKNFRRELSMGEVHYVWADPGAVQQQLAISSLVQAMFEKGVMAIARWVTKDGSDPKMGVLSPCVFENVDCLLFTPMPFADDVRKYTFASLETLVTKDGNNVKTHPYLPTDDQLDAMDAFVDAMDLMEAGEQNEDGTREPWFDTRLSYNPAVHRTKQALFHSAIVEDLAMNPLPPPHPELLRYFEPPKKVLKRARDQIEQCISALKVKEVPRKAPRARKDEHVRARDDDDEMLILDQFPKKSASQRANSQSQRRAKDEDDDSELLLGKAPADENGRPDPDDTAMAVDDVDPGRAPGRIIGSTFPLQDFRENIARGDLVTKAVADLALVVQDVVLKPFASRRHAEMIECLQALRDTALKEDEIDAWNASLQELRQACMQSPGNTKFWTEVKKLGIRGGLISDDEASQYGGTSDVTEKQALEFMEE